jgi:hypothetical protein
LILEKTIIKITPRTMTAVPRISVAVTAIASAITPYTARIEVDIRVPTNHLAKIKLKIKAVDPNGATQSGRRYFSARGEPTEVSHEGMVRLTCL